MHSYVRRSELETVHELAAVACFCGLAKREYFNSLAPYCNSDCFTLYIQKFTKADFTALTTRRREVRTWSGWPLDDIAITVPVHCHLIENVSLDEELSKSLVAYRAQTNSDKWARWQNAISCFNQANTDSDNIRYQIEWVLLCSAFEHLLEANSQAKDVASKFAQAMVPKNSLPASNASRSLSLRTCHHKSLRHVWMQEFYRIRGDFAHGKMDTQQPLTWKPLEHLVLGTIAFPLLVKSLLSKESRYTLTDKDRVQIDCFEKFAGTDNFLNPPPNQQDSLDSHWRRLLDECASSSVRERAAQLLQNLNFEGEGSDNG